MNTTAGTTVPRLLHIVVATVLCLSTLACWPLRASAAVTPLQNLCTIEGQQEIQLRGIGIVVGLNGTGDPDGRLTTMRPLASLLKSSGIPVETLEELKQTESVALVEVTATIPRTGINRGQTLDCALSAISGAESLEGGRLVATNLGFTNDRYVRARAAGNIVVQDRINPTTGVIPGGVSMEMTVDINIVGSNNTIRLLINKQYAGYQMAREIERAVNERFYLESGNREIATAVSAGAVDVEIPQQYDSAVEFAGHVLDVKANEAGSRAMVVVNSRAGTVVVTGSVEISPVVISHRNLNVEIEEPFVDIRNQDGRQSPQQLADLINALNQLKVPTDDIIGILREIHASGHLHAEFVER